MLLSDVLVHSTVKVPAQLNDLDNAALSFVERHCAGAGMGQHVSFAHTEFN